MKKFCDVILVASFGWRNGDDVKTSSDNKNKIR